MPMRPFKAAQATHRNDPGILPPRPVTSTKARSARAAAATNHQHVDDDEDDGSRHDSSAADDDDDANMMGGAETLGTDALPSASVPTAPVSTPLLARLLHEHFEHEGTQIQKGAMDLFATYIGIFVREAVARAKDERDKASARAGRAEGFLQVEHLERLTPQLVLDF